MKYLMSAAFAAASIAATPVAATTVTLDYRYPTINNVYLDLGTSPVPSQVSIFGGNVILDISSTQIRVANRTGCQPCTFLTGTFNGFALTFSDIGVLSTAIDPSTTFTDFTPDRITFQGNTLFLNFVNLQQYNPQFLLLNISTQVNGAVPEPASWALMIAGMGVIGATMRRRPATVALTL